MPHFQQVLQTRPAVDWFEVHSCNFLRGGLNCALLQRVAELYPLSLHGVSLNLGGVDPLDQDYLARLKILVKETNPVLLSEHACFTALDETHFHDLLPLPLSRAAGDNLVRRIDEVQTYLGRKILIENVSRYVMTPQTEMSEGEFLNDVCRRAGCGILLDLSNAYLNEYNLGWQVDDFLTHITPELVGEIHLGGFSSSGDYMIDSHGEPIDAKVLRLLGRVKDTYSGVPVLVEWDNNLPPFTKLMDEVHKVQSTLQLVNTDTASLSAINTVY